MAGIDLTHNYSFRVIYAQTDRMNVVYYSRYYEFFEAARSVLLRDIEYPYSKMENEGIMLPVTESYCRYYMPATYDDLLTVRTHIDTEPKVRMKILYDVFKDGHVEPIASGYTVHTFVNRHLKPVAAPADFLTRLRQFNGKIINSPESAS